MTHKQKKQFNQMYYTLLQISKSYQTPSQLKKNSRNQYGLDYEEALEMAYENIQLSAKAAIKGIKEVTEPLPASNVVYPYK